MFGLNFKHALLSDVYTPHHWLELLIEGTDAGKPAAGTAGRLYWATDIHILYKDTGAAWVELWRAEDVIRLAQLADKAHASLSGVTANQHHSESHSHIKGIIFNLGLATVGIKQGQALIPGAFTISKAKIYGDEVPTGASLIVDVNKNGTTIFTTQANRPEIAIGEHSDDSGSPNITSVAEGDRLSVDIDQVGSGVAGGDDLLVVIIFE